MSRPYLVSYVFEWFSVMMLVLHLISAPADALSLDGQSLIAFKRSLVGGGYKPAVPRDVSGSLATWNETDQDPCGRWESAWDGVVCDDGGRVIMLWLDGYSLRGDLTVLGESLASLDHLESLFMYGNFLSGEIPSSFRRLTNLKTLDLSDNVLSGNLNLENLPVSVDSLSLGNNKLIGGISGLLRFPNMTYLDLSANNLDGPIPGGMEVKLRSVNLSYNNFVGRIPEGSWNASQFDMSHNALTGSIPTSLLQAGAAERFFLGGNSLEGGIDIPPNSTFGKGLIVLDLSNNNLSGNIDSLLSQNLPALTELRLGRNNFSLADLQYKVIKLAAPGLQVLDLSQCNIKQADFFPRYDPNVRQYTPSGMPFQDMSFLDMSDNDMWGDFPSILTFFPLEELRMGGNGFTGNIQVSETAWGNLQVLDLAGNALIWNSTENTEDRGTLNIILNAYPKLRELRLGSNSSAPPYILPARTRKLSSFEVLDLRHTNVEGEIPAQLFTAASMPSLKFLDLSNNRITGPVPPSFSNMGNLTYLNVANNSLSGQLPPLPAILRNAAFFAGNPGLCGIPLSGCPSSVSIPWWQIVTGTSLIISLVCFLLLLWYRRMYIRRHQQDADLIAALHNTDRATLMPLKKLRKATSDFSDTCQIGQGGFGKVYRGVMDHNGVNTTVAIKKSLRSGSQEAKQEFLNEVRLLSNMNHRYLVRLLACCLENNVSLLVFEYVPNGTLLEHLRGRKGQFPLSWTQRLHIAVQTADALNYLHTTAVPTIYHGDVKSANILLDHNLHAKVADFGISRLVPHEATHVSMPVLQGTKGYIPAEYCQTFRLTAKVDVYAFGVVLLELISAQPALDISRDEDPSLATLAVPLITRGDLRDILDPSIALTFSSEAGNESIWSVARLAAACLAFDAADRPSMRKVLGQLQDLVHQFDVDHHVEESSNLSATGTDAENESVYSALLSESSSVLAGLSENVVLRESVSRSMSGGTAPLSSFPSTTGR